MSTEPAEVYYMVSYVNQCVMNLSCQVELFKICFYTLGGH